MDDIRQSTINNLSYFLTDKEIVTKDGKSIKFSEDTLNDNATGKFVIDDSKTGIYKIYFVEKLTLVLTATDDFKFKSYSNKLTSIALITDKNEISAIVEQIERLDIS